MMRTPENLADKAADKERFKASRGFAKRVKEILGDAPDIVFEHVGQATFPTSVFVVKPFGKGRHLRRHLGLPARLRRALPVDAPEADHRLALRQRLRVHARQPADGRGQGAAGAVEDDGLRGRPEAHQLLHENKHLGKISILVGAESEDEGKNEDGAGAIRAEVGA
jgi:crotonyl-CoA carboxylase/reductase